MAEGGSWITRYGVPGLIVSVAALLFQQQQQIFDRLRDSVQSGYQFYSSNRTGLSASADALREESLLRITGRVFPNIYCDVRQDMYERTNAAQAGLGFNADNPAAITSRDLADMRDALNKASRPQKEELPENLIDAALHPFSGPSHSCPALSDLQAQVADNTPAAQPPAAAPAPPPTAAAPSSVATREASPGGGAVAGMVAASADAPPHLDVLPSEMRVYFQIPLAGRDRSVIDAPLQDLEQYNYRIMRGVERVPSRSFTIGSRIGVNIGGGSASPTGAEVRYFGPDQEHAATQLANYLDYQFRAEHLHFTARAVNSLYPGMPRENIEVWIPPRAGAAAVPVAPATSP